MQGYNCTGRFVDKSVKLHCGGSHTTLRRKPHKTAAVGTIIIIRFDFYRECIIAMWGEVTVQRMPLA